MAGLDSITEAGKKIVEAPVEILNEGIVLIGATINGFIQESATTVDTAAKRVQAHITRPLTDLSSATQNLASKLPKSGLQLR